MEGFVMPSNVLPASSSRWVQFTQLLAALSLVALVVATSRLPQSAGQFSGETLNASNAFSSSTLAAPTALTATAGAGELHLAWTATTSTWADGYDILRSTTSGCCYTSVGSTSGVGATTFVDDGLVSGTTYYYIVRSRYLTWLSPDSGEAPGQPLAGVVALYKFDDFSGTTVADTSGFGVATDLTIADPANATWGTSSLTLNASTVVSKSDSSKLVNAMQATDAFTADVWVTPANLTQGGPARIVSISASTGSRNMTFGQEADRWELRVNSTTNSGNGLPALLTSTSLTSTTMYHGVATRDAAGTLRIYVDGVLVQSRTDGGTLADWQIVGREVVLGNEVTLDRPWLGTFHRVVLYDRALSGAEVAGLYAQGP